MVKFNLTDEVEDLWSFLDQAAVSIHLVGSDGTVHFANKMELDALGYTADEYIGHNIAEFHIDQNIIQDILTRLTNGETLLSYVARLKKKDGSILYVSINSNVYKKDETFVHTRCFTSEINEFAWDSLKNIQELS
ncbi:PAS domain-containing protein [Colwellia piezophila]|uniref:PAS domain-containing protein n=1 Tax=Colwellia piezophila TaxID=211668 RepID=UPI000376F938|nr:PAS domain-containing protein [Colwellia piezophila]